MKKSEIRIVIVDDEPIIRMDLREILESKGYQVVGEAADGFDAVELCRTHVPDLVHAFCRVLQHQIHQLLRRRPDSPSIPEFLLSPF